MRGMNETRADRKKANRKKANTNSYYSKKDHKKKDNTNPYYSKKRLRASGYGESTTAKTNGAIGNERFVAKQDSENNRANKSNNRMEDYSASGLHPENPTLPFQESPPPRNDSRMEAFRVWMHSSQKWIYAFLLISLCGPAVYRMTAPEPGLSDLIQNHYRSERSVDQPAYSIGDFQRSKWDLKQTYLAFHSLISGNADPEKGRKEALDSAGYSRFARSSFEVDLLARRALEEKLLSDARVRRFVSHSLRTALARVYVLHSLRKRPPANHSSVPNSEKAANGDHSSAPGKSEISKEIRVRWRHLVRDNKSRPGAAIQSDFR
ncbi:MAG: hypothetical protein CMN76_13205 [Spirochaetaceae bacterium]|nr:hypothetical protein [Spirochaetaceae bacterium]|tara:strand:+ start:58662 stop:59624 length:963 start_codon:yes stop_codon:yes gene_type:complete